MSDNNQTNRTTNKVPKYDLAGTTTTPSDYYATHKPISVVINDNDEKWRKIRDRKGKGGIENGRNCKRYK